MNLKYNQKLKPLPPDINLPNHIAFSPNGNRRWAQEKNLPTLEGHKAGAEALKRLIEAGYHYGIRTMTFWGFSTENWNRAEEEVGYLMKLFEWLYDNYLDEVLKYNVRIVHLGRKDRMPQSLAQKIQQSEESTKHITERVLNLAADYGGHDELLRAFSKASDDISSGKISKEKLFEVDGWYEENKLPYYHFKNYLDTKDQPFPYPDIVIRTAGDKRTSGFLPWQSAYAEYLWFDEYFPDLTGDHLYEAIIQFSERERRFGGNK